MNDSILISDLAKRLGFNSKTWKRSVLNWCDRHKLTVSKVGKFGEVSKKVVESIIIQQRIADFKLTHKENWENEYIRQYGGIPIVTAAEIVPQSEEAKNMMNEFG